MRKIIAAVAITAAVALGGAFFSQAQASAVAGAIPLDTQASQPIHPAACRGRGPFCPPGRHRVCGPYGHRCWCAPC